MGSCVSLKISEVELQTIREEIQIIESNLEELDSEIDKVLSHGDQATMKLLFQKIIDHSATLAIMKEELLPISDQVKITNAIDRSQTLLNTLREVLEMGF